MITLAALIALGAIVSWKTEIFTLRKGYMLRGSFDSIEGLTLGSEVRYRGLKVGKVAKIDPGPYDIRVISLIEKDIKFPSDSILRVSYDGIVGLKFLEVKPGTSEVIYDPKMVLYGIKTAAIVDFIDIGSQNLQETKKIMEEIRHIVENKDMQASLLQTVFTVDRVASNLEKLTEEIRQTNRGIQEIVSDPQFQRNVKGTIRETERTLSSANKFFDSVGQINLRASAGLDVGTRANEVRGNVDLIQSEKNYFRFGMGEGPTRTLSLLDVLYNAKITDDFGFRVGVINNQMGGGVAFFPAKKVAYRGDVYDINNPRPNWPKIRLSYDYELRDYMDLTLKGDDLLNDGSRNVSIGIRVKPLGAGLY